MKPHFAINCFKQLKKIIQFCFAEERSAKQIINAASFVTIALMLFVSSCTIPSNNEAPLLKAENILLKVRNDSLLAIINNLTTPPEEIIIDAKNLIAINKPDSALILLNALDSKIPGTKTIAALNKLKKQLTGKQKIPKKKVYTNASDHNLLNKKAKKNCYHKF